MTEPRQKMLERVRAIISKTVANGCTEGEALAAIAKAQELMAAYDISEADLGVTKPQEGANIFAANGDDPYDIKRWLAPGIAEFTRTLWWQRGRDGGISFCGLESETAFAVWLLEMLQAFVLRELKAFQADRRRNGLKTPRIISSSFVLGATQRIRDRLAELAPREPVGPTASALTTSRKPLIDATMAASGINLRVARSWSRRVNEAGYGAGQSAGDRARFDRPVGSGGLRRIGK